MLCINAMVQAATSPDEGMYPLSELKKVNLAKAGFEIPMNEIYNPQGISLIDALVNVGGCTGSFISDKGLIITNHHCAFSAVQLASTPENDYINKGFVARNAEQEIEAKGLTCRITDSYEDVSTKVLAAGARASDPASRIKLIKDEMKNLAKRAEMADPGIKAEVSEMFIGKTYILFKYRIIQDVRLVYVPNRSIGEFGGETDNWVWPRHTGDFSFMRAYVAPDGKPAKYSKKNVPYTPKKFLKVNASGVNENDFVFILGYPGRTFRNRPYQYIQYQQQFQLPYTAELYEYENKAMDEAGKDNKATEIKLATRIKRNANVLKNYRGKLKGLNAIGLIDKKKKEDAELSAFIRSDASLSRKYGSLMTGIDNLYKQVFNEAYRELWFSQIYSSTSMLNASAYINSFKKAMNARPAAQRTAFLTDSAKYLMNSLRTIYNSYDAHADRAIFAKMLSDAAAFPANQRILAVDNSMKGSKDKAAQINEVLSATLQRSRINDSSFVFNELLSSVTKLNNYTDALLSFEGELRQQQQQHKQETERREGELNKLMGDYVTVKELFKKQNFMPDANSTLRMTYGHIKGYSPVDASWMKPFTTIKGIIEKGASGNPDFEYPSSIKKLWEAKDFGPFVKNDLNDVPVAFLYDMDTTGGNSGSPVMNAKGELVAVNFDRVYEATINDYAWNESYSRSIGVDIRYVLWVASKVDHADFLLREINAK